MSYPGPVSLLPKFIQLKDLTEVFFRPPELEGSLA